MDYCRYFCLSRKMARSQARSTECQPLPYFVIFSTFLNSTNFDYRSSVHYLYFHSCHHFGLSQPQDLAVDPVQTRFVSEFPSADHM